MTFSTHNSFYLRISTNIVLPVYVYLDERHLNWMSDNILQHVLSDLRPFILPKLKAEADGLTGSASTQKKATVDTYRGDTYQFCYFIRKTEPHSVILKARNFRAAPPRKIQPLQASSNKKRGKRKAPSSSKAKKRQRNEGQLNDDDADYVDVVTDDEPDQGQDHFNPPMELENEEEEKPKLMLTLQYQGFSIYGQCLCVVVEPWPVVRSKVVATIVATNAVAGTTLAVPSERSIQAGSPLFLPEESEEPSTERRPSINQSYLDQILKDIDSDEEDSDMGGMLEFSQVLYNVSDSRAGAANDDDDDIDDSVLFGDADECREL